MAAFGKPKFMSDSPKGGESCQPMCAVCDGRPHQSELCIPSCEPCANSTESAGAVEPPALMRLGVPDGYAAKTEWGRHRSR
jgi:hypothetical protein